MYTNESVFEEKVISVLKEDRKNIERQYRPFKELNYSVDLISIFNNMEEWRELKIIYYKNKSKSIQNLWKGFGKVILMQDLARKLLEENSYPVDNILTIHEFDFSRIPKSVIDSMTSVILIEKLINKKTIKLTKVNQSWQ